MLLCGAGIQPAKAFINILLTSEARPHRRVRAFRYDQELIRIDIPENLFEPAWPRNLDRAGAHFRTHPEVRAKIALREIAATPRDLANLRDSAGGQFDASAHRVAVALCPDEFHAEEVISRAPAIAQQQWRLSAVPDQDIDVAVIIEIHERRAPPEMRDLERLAGD